ncbi:MAG TPA: DUF1264 domain-containing protein [Gemmatimonadales bacterium]|nr:DUF1264 domain-containing protein [Gemmatimonadales bacterium]
MKLLIIGGAAVAAMTLALARGNAKPDDPAPRASTAADGYTIHVTAPHVYRGKASEPVHHWCKPVAPDPVIVCQLFNTADSTAMLMGVEYIVAKTLTRPKVPLATWNANFHDHAAEIATGRVQVLGMAPEDAKKVADLVATTDGIIFHLWPDGDPFPTGEVMIDQAVGHRALTAAEYGKP